jgi:hypothetical protein
MANAALLPGTLDLLTLNGVSLVSLPSCRTASHPANHARDAARLKRDKGKGKRQKAKENGVLLRFELRVTLVSLRELPSPATFAPPSGDHAGALSAAGSDVSGWGSPLSTSFTKMSKLSPVFRSQANAIRLPSGESTGSASAPGRLVTGVLLDERDAECDF